MEETLHPFDDPVDLLEAATGLLTGPLARLVRVLGVVRDPVDLFGERFHVERRPRDRLRLVDRPRGDLFVRLFERGGVPHELRGGLVEFVQKPHNALLDAPPRQVPILDHRRPSTEG